MHSLHLQTVISRNPNLIAAEMDGDLVMMSIEKGEYFGISGVGSRVWALLESPMTLQQICRLICHEFAVDETACTQDLQDFSQEMLALGLIRAA